jgi:tetratricopeptide (TPR) repeat protein
MPSPIPFADDPSHQLRELVHSARYREALDWYRRVEDGGGDPAADARLMVATAATRLGEFALAATLAEGALRRFGSRGDLDGKMRALNLLGVIAFERGDLVEAEEYLGEALRLATHLQDSLIAARACNNLASVIHLRGRPDEAVGLYRGALLSYQRLGDRRGTAETYHNLGLTFRQMAEWREAEKAVHQAVRHAEFVGEPALMALTSTGRAELRIEQGEISFALPELERAGRLADRAGDVVGAAEVRRIRALAAMKDGDYRLAAEEAEGARAIAWAHEVALLRAECAAIAALAYRGLGRTEEAEERRAEAAAGFSALGAVRLLAHFEADWSDGGRSGGGVPPRTP